jgi:phage terminase large subunit
MATTAIKTTRALRKIAALKKRIWVIQGGQGAGKTFAILTLIINHCAGNPDREVIIASAELSKMKLTVVKDFIKILKAFGIYKQWAFKAGSFYRFESGSFVKFIGLDAEDIGKGLRSDLVFVNEANKISFEAYRELTSRAKRVILDYNPNEAFWAHDEVKPRDDADFLVLTYKDNEHLSAEEVNEILYYKRKAYFDPDLVDYDTPDNVRSEYWRNKWRVYGLGLEGSLAGVIFSNWKQVPTVPKEAKLLCYGLDFGFSSDPAATVALYQMNGAIIVDEVLYRTGLTNPDIAREWKRAQLFRGAWFYADGSEPKSIKELWAHGFKVRAADKGPDSINFGIDLLQSFEMLVTSRSTNLLEELRTYKWAKDRNGRPLGKPEDRNNHAIDALRYAAVMTLKRYAPNYKSKSLGNPKRKLAKDYYKGLV